MYTAISSGTARGSSPERAQSASVCREDREVFENLSLPHLLMVLAVALLVFGPKRIPEIAGSMGKGIREFRRSIATTGSDDRTGLPDASLPRSTLGSGETTVPAEGSEPKRLLS
ncbi:MAG: twin-arginine translocase TatA/TatE family subunit [Gemmatimonadota bacterium]|nr:twin-arginine translocase TatA/TatE family subunit [Gemmatimonadota bacterium]